MNTTEIEFYCSVKHPRQTFHFGFNCAEYILCFHKALLSSAFNESEFSSNYVVMVTAITHWAICVSLVSANQLSFRSNPLYVQQSSHATFLCQTPLLIVLNGAWLLNAARVSHINLKPKMCICVSAFEQCMVLNACMFLFGSLVRRNNLRFKK